MDISSILITIGLLYLAYIVYRVWFNRQNKSNQPQKAISSPITKPKVPYTPKKIDWPELEVAQQAKLAEMEEANQQSGLQWASRKEHFQNYVKDAQYRAIIKEWNPQIKPLLEQIAEATIWMPKTSSELQASDLVIRLNKKNDTIIWTVGGGHGGPLNTGGSVSITEEFTVTLIFDEAHKPGHFLIGSRTRQQTIPLDITALRMALIEAYLDGPQGHYIGVG